MVTVDRHRSSSVPTATTVSGVSDSATASTVGDRGALSLTPLTVVAVGTLLLR